MFRNYDSWKLDTPPRYEDAVPPDPREDAGADPDEALLSAARECLEVMAGWGLDGYSAYGALLSAVDAKERARNEAAKSVIR